MLKIGELAKQAGVTVRALHYYDFLHLVSPSHRSPKGYRLYSADDVARLYMVRTLQDLGFSLEQVKSMVRGKNFSFKKVLRMHLDNLERKISRERILHKKLRELEGLINPKKHVLMEDIIYLLQIMDNIQQFGLNPADEEKLKAHWGKYTPEDIKAVEQEWPKLIAEARNCMERGVDPKSPEMQKLAKRWAELVNMFTGGIQKMADMAQKNITENNEQLRAQYGDGVPDRKLLDYIQKALS